MHSLTPDAATSGYPEMHISSSVLQRQNDPNPQQEP